MKPPKFWWRSPHSLLALLFRPLGFGYDWLVGLRLRKKSERVSIPVLCVGNFIMGGAGKTPTALALCQLLSARGHRCAFLSRGYGGHLTGSILVDTKTHTTQDVGDEALLLAKKAITVVSRDRVAGAKLCQQLGADVIIMDDGMQNTSLHKDVVVAVWDGLRGIGNGLCFPAGPLRASLKTQAKLADMMIVVDSVDSEHGRFSVWKDLNIQNIPVFFGKLIPDKAISEGLLGKKVIAFAGIGYPEKFYNTLRQYGAELVKTYDFDDHHEYSVQELSDIMREAQRLDCEIFTTTKDYMRIQFTLPKNNDDSPFQVLPVELCCEMEDQLVCFIENKLFHD